MVIKSLVKVGPSVCGAFRHRECVRFSSSGEPFQNLTCSVCARIPQEKDFRMRVVREDRSFISEKGEQMYWSR